MTFLIGNKYTKGHDLERRSVQHVEWTSVRSSDAPVSTQLDCMQFGVTGQSICTRQRCYPGKGCCKDVGIDHAFMGKNDSHKE